jgi:hypothetical protein
MKSLNLCRIQDTDVNCVGQTIEKVPWKKEETEKDALPLSIAPDGSRIDFVNTMMRTGGHDMVT